MHGVRRARSFELFNPKVEGADDGGGECRLLVFVQEPDLAAQALDGELQALYALLGCEPNPIPLKWCLAQLGHGQAQLRLPLLPLNARHHAAGRAALVSLGLVEASAASGRLAG